MESITSGPSKVVSRLPGPKIKPGSSLPASSTYLDFEVEVCRELAPRGFLEVLASRQVARTAWSLQEILDRPPTRRARERSSDDGTSAGTRVRASKADLASRSFRDAIETLRLVREGAPGGKSSPGHPVEPPTEIYPNEWPIVPTQDDETIIDGLISCGPEAPTWRDRLVFDFEVSDSSPVVKGTWITVGHVISLIVDGWTWADILRAHPELTEADVRTCVAYTMAEGAATP